MARLTIQNILAMPNPTFHLNSPNPRAPEIRISWINAQHCRVRRWDDFNLGNLSSAFGDVLSQPASVGIGPVAAHREVQNLSEMKNDCINSLLNILEGPVDSGRRLLGHRLGSTMPIAHSQNIKLQGGYVPSLTFYINAASRALLVVSCARLSATWTSEELQNHESGDTSPICQLATYARESKTRYGFVMTDKEVVVVRFSVGTCGEYIAEWQAIPRSANDEGVLTVGLAVWSLVMMSLNENHRTVATETQTLPINLWWGEQRAGGDINYRHHLSGRELPSLHSGAVRWFKKAQ
ncbi:hypothetical protein NCS56_00517100 [Fusarium sp. Ph1]|nr:hypothetical protein NCS56_00517100 [Fusarium sp. Ph1]